MFSYTTFIFESYRLDLESRQIELVYSLDSSLRFSELILLPADFQLQASINQGALEKALFNLHLIGGISYYKTYCPKQIEIKSGELDEEQAEFWRVVYQKGLGQFAYENKLNPYNFAHFPYSKAVISPKSSHIKEVEKQNLLVPIGGGKDSMVTIELLKKAQIPVTLFRVGHHPVITRLAKEVGAQLLTVERKLDASLFRLNNEGAYNGHVPISAYISFLAVVVGVLYGFDAVVMSNERSSNYGNVEYLGEEINHQWSKSLEFENLFQNYVSKKLGSSFQYLNPLRPLSELAISRLFSQYPHYFSLSTSCNTNWRILAKSDDRPHWCGICPKCAFVFLMFAPYMPYQTLISLFGSNLLDEQELVPTYLQLLGLEGFKPFECVGTPEEAAVAFSLISERDEFKNTRSVRLFSERMGELDLSKMREEILSPECEYVSTESNNQLGNLTGICASKN